MSVGRSGGGALFAYGSLVDPASAAATLGRDPAEGPSTVAAELAGWRRGFTQARDNRACEKSFALDADGSLPDFVLGLNVHRSGEAADSVNGVVIQFEEAELRRLDERELRYRRVEVRAGLRLGAPLDPGPVYVYVAKPEHLALEPPWGSVILRSYAEAVEAAFEGLGPGHLRAYRESVHPLPTELVDAHLVRDSIPPGNPRDW